MLSLPGSCQVALTALDVPQRERLAAAQNGRGLCRREERRGLRRRLERAEHDARAGDPSALKRDRRRLDGGDGDAVQDLGDRADGLPVLLAHVRQIEAGLAERPVRDR